VSSSSTATATIGLILGIAPQARVVLTDMLGGKDVVEGRDGRTDVSDSYRTYSCKNGITCLDSFFILPLINTVG
jgi:hypothetical protein